MIRRLTSYCFLFLFILNSIGYFGLVEVVKMKLASQTVQKFESEGQELGGNLIFAIPGEIPYAVNTNGYISVDGEIVYNEEVYQLVREKYFNGVLYVVCKSNPRATKVRDELIDYTRVFSGQEASQTNSTIKIINLVSKYYVLMAFSNERVAAAWKLDVDPEIYADLYCLDLSSPIFHPPQLHLPLSA